MLKNIILLCLILLLISCGQSNKQRYQISDKKYFSDFQIIYIDSYTDSFSSKDSAFSRNYIAGKKRIKCFLTVTEKKNILEIIDDNDFLDLPDILPENHNGTCQMPAFPVEIIVIYGKNQKKVIHEGMCDVKHKNQLKRFDNVLNEIEKIIYGNKQVKELKQTDQVFL
jgi:hypothetical protein